MWHEYKGLTRYLYSEIDDELRTQGYSKEVRKQALLAAARVARMYDDNCGTEWPTSAAGNVWQAARNTAAIERGDPPPPAPTPKEG